MEQSVDEMNPQGHLPSRKIRRTANACTPCRQSKIKCSGEDPCANCQRRRVKCRFEDCDNRVTVSQRYLRHLQRQANDARRTSEVPRQLDPPRADEALVNTHGITSPSSRTSQGAKPADAASQNELGEEAFPSPSKHSCLDHLVPLNVDEACSIWTSPFQYPTTTMRYKYKNKSNWIWLAPASTWSFTIRLTILLHDKLELEPPSSVRHFDEIYPLTWNNLAPDSIPDITGLPSLDHALYLFDTVKFHFGQNYRFFDEAAFTENTHQLYASGGAARMASESRLWFAQFLLIMAFGKAFLSRPQSSGIPPGSSYFIRAMSVMPEITSVWKDSLLAIEVLALTGLYLYAVDQRESAHVYVAQAVRIAQMEGLHTQLPEDELGSGTVARCRNLWWMLYIIDRHFSSSLGVPMTTPDSDITTQFDETKSHMERGSTLRLQVNLSKLLSHIISTIYKSQKTQLGIFLDATRSILASMAGYAQEIEQLVQCKLESSIEAMTRETRHITLSYHQCVIVATRPILLSVLKERLENLREGNGDWGSFLSLTKPLIATGIKSAVKTAQILSTEDGLLEFFLPFDLEFIFGAAIYLAMANALFPATDESILYRSTADDLLAEMAAKGNKVAGIRKKELDDLQALLTELCKRAENSGLQTLTLATPELVEFRLRQQLQAQCNAPSTDIQQHDATLSTGLEPNTLFSRSNDQIEPLNNEFLDNIGISSFEFFNMVEQMSGQDATFTMPN